MSELPENIVDYYRAAAAAVVKKYGPKTVAVFGSRSIEAAQAIACVLGAGVSAAPERTEVGKPADALNLASLSQSGAGPVNAGLHLLLSYLGLRPYPKVVVAQVGLNYPGAGADAASVLHPNVVVLVGNPSDYTAAERTELSVLTNALDEGSTVLYSGSEVAGLTGSGSATWKSYEPDGSAAEDLARTYTTLLPTLLGPEPITVRGVGGTRLQAACAAAAVAQLLSEDRKASAQQLSQYRFTPGTGSVLPGIKRTIVIDATLDARPTDTVQDLALLQRMGASSALVVVGFSNEPAPSSATELAVAISGANPKTVILVGTLGERIKTALTESGFAAENIHLSEDAAAAAVYCNQVLESGSTVLVSGERRLGLEEVVREIMAEPMKAPVLLVRRSGT